MGLSYVVGVFTSYVLQAVILINNIHVSYINVTMVAFLLIETNELTSLSTISRWNQLKLKMDANFIF